MSDHQEAFDPQQPTLHSVMSTEVEWFYQEVSVEQSETLDMKGVKWFDKEDMKGMNRLTCNRRLVEIQIPLMAVDEPQNVESLYNESK